MIEYKKPEPIKMPTAIPYENGDSYEMHLVKSKIAKPEWMEVVIKKDGGIFAFKIPTEHYENPELLNEKSIFIFCREYANNDVTFDISEIRNAIKQINA